MLDERVLLVLRAVARTQLCVCGRPDDLMWCPYCPAFLEYPQEGQEVQHAADCPILVARLLLRTLDGGVA